MTEQTNNKAKGAGIWTAESFAADSGGTLAAPLPKEQKVARTLITQAHKMQADLFSVLEEKKQATYPDGSIVYSALPSLISEYDFRAYILAAQLTLHDQSYICNNLEEGKGKKKTIINSGARREISNLQSGDGTPLYNGNIVVSLNDLCRVGYGIPDGKDPVTSQRNNMRKAIEVLDSNPIGMILPNGDEKRTYLIKIMEVFKRKKDGAEMYHLVLNPIFTSNAKGYGTMLRGATTRLSKYLASKGKTGKAGKSAAHYAFLQLISIQDKRKEWHISLENLLQNLNLLEQFKKDKKRTTAKLESIFEAFYSIGLLQERPEETIPSTGIYSFKINPEQCINPEDLDSILED